MGKPLENNRAHISGVVLEDFVLDHEAYGEKFYKTKVATKRLSEVEDFVPVLASGRLINVNDEWAGKKVDIYGSFRSCNINHHLNLHLFTDKIEAVDSFTEDENDIYLDGFICREVVYRETPLGRELSEVMLAVNRQHKSDYIPCICWGRNARYAGTLPVGTRVKIEGRIQSRDYQKWIDDDTEETRTCYEVSANMIEVVEESEANEDESRDSA